MRCYFPGYLTSSSGSSLNTDIFLIKDLFHSRYSKRGQYWGMYAKYNVQETYQTAGTSGSMNLYENSGFWNSA